MAETKMADGVVLMVEDNQKLLSVNRKILEKCGCIVITASTLAEARERLSVNAPDAIVLDIMLPDGDGVEFLSELRQTCGAPVLFLSAKAEAEDILAGLAAGGLDYITKPYNIDEFRLRVTGMLNFVNAAKADRNLCNLATLLPQRELTIARMAADGINNRRIAETVCLSESRVKTCLSDIYKKLGITGIRDKRRELARMLDV